MVITVPLCSEIRTLNTHPSIWYTPLKIIDEAWIGEATFHKWIHYVLNPLCAGRT